jgi:hypothetical protein
MGFAILVEMLNLRMKKNAAKKKAKREAEKSRQLQ